MVKRVFQMVVLFFAIYAFVFVPLGRKTALEHVRAIAGTSAAQQAATELQGGVKRLVHELREEAQRSTEATDEKIAGNEEPEPERADRVKPAPKLRPSEVGAGGAKAARRGPERLSRGPAGTAGGLDSSRLDLSGMDHPPDLKELHSPQPSRSTR